MGEQSIAKAMGVAWMLAISIIVGSNALGASVETLLMPGKVSRAHVKQ